MEKEPQKQIERRLLGHEEYRDGKWVFVLDREKPKLNWKIVYVPYPDPA